MQRKVESIENWSEVILGQLGNPRVFKLNVVRVNNANGLIVDSGLAPGSTLRIGSSMMENSIEPGFLVGLSLHPFGYGSTVRIPDSLSDDEAIVRLAEQFQEEVWESNRGDPVPSCPGHVHPAKPMILKSTPYWVCPRDGSIIQPILTDDSR